MPFPAAVLAKLFLDKEGIVAIGPTFTLETLPRIAFVAILYHPRRRIVGTRNTASATIFFVLSAAIVSFILTHLPAKPLIDPERRSAPVQSQRPVFAGLAVADHPGCAFLVVTDFAAIVVGTRTLRRRTRHGLRRGARRVVCWGRGGGVGRRTCRARRRGIRWYIRWGNRRGGCGSWSCRVSRRLRRWGGRRGGSGFICRATCRPWSGRVAA